MKIGILTMPLNNNYGGILQAYALQKILKKMGHDAWHIRRVNSQIPLWRKIASILKGWILHFIFKDRKRPLLPFWATEVQKNYIEQYTGAFIKENISPQTELLKSNRALRIEIKKQKFDALIVGSDQVWRPEYSLNITNYFLDFVKKRTDVLKVAYAASFGVDYWEFTKKQTKDCAVLAQKFNAISVREESGVSLCKRYLGVNAVQLLDPTLLLDQSDYIDLLKEDQKIVCEGNMLTYILDSSQNKDRIIANIAQQTGLQPFSVNPKQKLKRESQHKIKECIYPPVTRWIKGFLDAQYVVTDSFHGCVFSIIFNKPFMVIGNKERGMTRFISLLKKFKLESRLISDSDLLQEDLFLSEINWEEVNRIREEEKERSIQYLQYYLK